MIPSMHRRRLAGALLALAPLAACHHAAPPAIGAPSTASSPLDTLAPRALRYAAAQLARSADSLDPRDGWPRETRPDGRWHQVPAGDWTSGFFPGLLWQMYDLTRDSVWRARAERWTAGLEVNKTRRGTHDLGFMIFDSFGQGYRLTGNPHYRDVILEASATLAQRYDPTVGAIKSWDTERARDRRATWKYPVIIDNLMNLEMLFWAGAHGGDPAWRAMAERHALTSARAHVRPDGSTYHVVSFDPATGAVDIRTTWQGYADTSAWARGQAWAVYGFTTAYAETKRPELLDAARRTADWFIAHLPADGVPYWDFRDPAVPHTERDASAAAIAASGLLALARQVSAADAARYRAAAEHILTSLATSYLTTGTNSAAILQHAVGAKPLHSEIDVGLIYGDYYFVEALRRWTEGGAR